MAYEKIDDGSFKRIETNPIETHYSVIALQNQKLMLEKELAEIIALLVEAKKIGCKVAVAIGT